MHRRAAWLLLGLSLLAASCDVEPTVDSVAEARGAVQNGKLAMGDDAVVGIYLDNVILCTGTLITPKVVVTAAHCLVPQELMGHSITELEIHVGPDVFNPVQKLAVAEGLAHPSFDFATMNLAGNHDVGLIRLTAPASITPVPMMSKTSATALKKGLLLRVLGYGVTGPGLMDYGTKREAAATIGTLAPDWIRLSPAAMCAGDSGGPYLATLDGVEYVVATHSHGNCQTDSEGSRLDPVIDDFIAPFVAKDCPEDGTCDPTCAGAGAVDPDCACAADSVCNPDCSSDTGDPDCVCVSDGRCDTDCPETPDPDCPPPHPPVTQPKPSNSGCSMATSDGADPGKIAVITVAAVACSLVLSRRRLRPSV